MPLPSFPGARQSVAGLALSMLMLPLTGVSAAPALRAEDVALLAASCANCHGPAQGSSADIPTLRGQSADRLKQRMLDFKQGKAADATVMTRLMKGYEVAEIDALAQWFGAAGHPKEAP